MSSHKPLAINDDSQAEGQWDVGGSSSLLQRTTARWKQTIYQMDWKQFAINNGLLFTLLILSTAQLVLAKKTSARLKNYPFSLAQAQPVITSTLFGMLYLCSLAYASIQNLYFPEDSTDCSSGDEKSRLIDSSEKNATTEEEQTWYWWTKLYFHLAVVGTFLSIGNILQFSGLRGDYVPGPVATLLQQMTIPATIIICIFLFRTRFFFWHYLGAIVVLGGVLLTLGPDIKEMEEQQGAKSWAVLSLIGFAVCSAMAMAYLGHFIVHVKNLNMWWMWMVINIFEIFTTVPLMVAVAPLTDVSFDDTFPNIGHGYACLFAGINTEKNDNCPDAILFYIPLMLVIVSSRMNVSLVVQRMNAALMWFVVTCALPLADIAFTLHFIMGDDATSLTPYIIGGLLLVMAGLLMYRLSREPEPEGYAFLHRGVFNLLCRCRLHEDDQRYHERDPVAICSDEEA